MKAASDIYAPVSGQIEAVNEKLNDEPSLLNKQPESDGTYYADPPSAAVHKPLLTRHVLLSFASVSTGWLCQIKLSNPSDFETLLTAEAYQKICEN